MSTLEAELRKFLAEVTEPTAKAEVQKVLDLLPDAFTMEDLVEQLDEREHIRQGLWSALNEPLVSQEEMKVWFEEWVRREPEASAASTKEVELWSELPYDRLRGQMDDRLHAAGEMSITTSEVREVMDGLSGDCIVIDIVYALYVRGQIKQGLRSLENEPTWTQDEIEQSLSRWLS
jgi:hypothetical protein